MTQYVDVLKKAISSLPSDTLEGRTQLYTAARGALTRQLQNNNNVPQPEKVRQLEAFEAAVRTIEKEYVPEHKAEPEFIPEAEPEFEPQGVGALEEDDFQRSQSAVDDDQVVEPSLAQDHEADGVFAPEPQSEPELEQRQESEQPSVKTIEPEAIAENEDDIFDGSETSTSDTLEAVSDAETLSVDKIELDDADKNLSDIIDRARGASLDAAVNQADASVPSAIKQDIQEKKPSVEDFGLKVDDRLRLSPHGDKDSAIIHGSSLAKSGLGKVWIALAVVLLLAGGTAAAYFGRNDIAQLFAKDTAPASKTAEQLAADRLNAETNGSVVDKVVTSTPIVVTQPTAPDVRVVTPETVAPPQTDSPDPVVQQLAAEQAQAEAAAKAEAEAQAKAEVEAEAQAKAAAELAQQNADQAAQQTIIADAAPVQLVEGPAARGAALYEESPDDPNKELAWAGAIEWQTLAEVQSNGTTSPAIVGTADVPGRGMMVTITIRRNSDASFDASHTIDLEFTSVEGENLPSVQDVGAVLLKENEPSRGEPLAAGKAKVTDGYFLFALGSASETKEQNITLLKSKDWFDIPVLFSDNRRAIVVLHKGFEGKAVFDNALAAWARLDDGQ